MVARNEIVYTRYRNSSIFPVSYIGQNSPCQSYHAKIIFYIYYIEFFL